MLRRLNYEEILSLNTRLLLTLQNKLTLLSSEDSLAQSKRKTSINLVFISQNKLALLSSKKSLAQSERKTSNNLVLVSQLTRVFTNNAKISIS